MLQEIVRGAAGSRAAAGGGAARERPAGESRAVLAEPMEGPARPDPPGRRAQEMPPPSGESRCVDRAAGPPSRAWGGSRPVEPRLGAGDRLRTRGGAGSGRARPAAAAEPAGVARPGPGALLGVGGRSVNPGAM